MLATPFTVSRISTTPKSVATQRPDVDEAVNTGPGGSADTRTKDTVYLQRALLLHLNAGVIGRDRDTAELSAKKNVSLTNGTRSSTEASKVTMLREAALPASVASLDSTTMPEPWVKASFLVRSNSLASGNSGVRVELLRDFVRFMNSGLVPLVPLRGSISASGDLSSLSYIAGAMSGDPGIRVWTGDKASRKLVRADAALKEAQIVPTLFGPKEVISIVNGTAFSAGVAALALHDTHCFTILTEVLTAMAVEALQGTAESFLPFFGQTRPHPGQIESARHILHFLDGSKLLKSEDGWEKSGLRQDRYSVRTASQWIGPQIEELMLAHTQVVTECNSTTDNPLVDTAGGRILHGGNFQAMAVTSAMERTRSSLQVFGRMLFAQLTELINPAFNNGLPPNLTAEDPSRDFLMKGMDTSAASYASELGFLAQRVTPHVMSAEMHNQTINSLALISARYTFTALDVFSALASTALVAYCQALDLRAIHHHFLAAFEPTFKEKTSAVVPASLLQSSPQLFENLWKQFQTELARTTTLDIAPRFQASVASVTTALLL